MDSSSQDIMLIFAVRQKVGEKINLIQQGRKRNLRGDFCRVFRVGLDFRTAVAKVGGVTVLRFLSVLFRNLGLIKRTIIRSWSPELIFRL